MVWTHIISAFLMDFPKPASPGVHAFSGSNKAFGSRRRNKVNMAIFRPKPAVPPGEDSGRVRCPVDLCRRLKDVRPDPKTPIRHV